ncbi:MAG: diadenylate cyclase CdaA [Planctomycetes bacterium]|nr:diadenylate cyclase CdaA [Planctomycetota bacterium]MCW8134580.1 diadenylate cyclase CdaA [Planctomycetota bacterium]
MTEYLIYGVEILLIYLFLLLVYKFVKGSTGDSALRGVAIIFTLLLISIYLVADTLGLYRIEKLLEKVVDYLFIAVLVVFQPELRRGLSRIGQNRMFLRILAKREDLVPRMVATVFRLARAKTGGLMAIERGVGLRNYIERGIELDALFTPELIDSIFYPGNPLHDGAIIVRGSRVVAAGCLFPLTENPDVSKRLGTRHRAGIGLSEETDALVIIISEETGKVSVAMRGELVQDLSRDQLERFLRDNLGDALAAAVPESQPAVQP